jgi:hypothetical protein
LGALVLRNSPASPRHDPLCCARCSSELVQPLGWRELSHGFVQLHLRCPECGERSAVSCDHERVAEYDDALVRGRQELERGYAALVKRNMAALADTLATAFALDLIDADDFAVGRERQ